MKQDTNESPVMLPDGSDTDTPHHRFIARRKLRDSLLKKATAQEQLTERMLSRLDTIQDYLADDTNWFAKLEKASLRDLAIVEGVYVDKVQLLQGKATSVIGVQHQEKLDQVLPLLLDAMKQRGLTIGVSERRLEIKT